MWTWMIAMALGTELPELTWNVVNDSVMGGVSTGQVTQDGDVSFTGELSLDNNGGFASIRTRPTDLGLDGVRAFRLTVRGDGRVWDFTLRRSDVPIRAGSYRVQVATAPEPIEVEVPLSAFRPSSFGRPVMGAPALDTAPERIDSLGFLLADKQPGPFALEVLDITPVRGAAPRGEGWPEVKQRLQQAVSAGVPAFNGGDVSGCRDLYAAALTELVDHPTLTPGERSIVAQAIASAPSQPPTEAAWTLRHAIDTLLAG